MNRVLALLLLVGALGCRESRVTIQVMIPDASGNLGPAAGVTVVALPYDRDSLLTSMENAAASSRPHTALLDSLFQLFREPFAESTRLAAQVDRIRDSLRAAESDPSRTTDALALRDSLSRTEQRYAEASRRLAVVREAVGSEIDSLRAEVRGWEQATFRDWAQTTRSLTSGRLVAGISDTTRYDGSARLYLPPGGRSWWVYARSFNSGDPNSEWYWNLPVTGPTVTLDTSTGRLRPRY